MKKAVSFGISLENAVSAVTANPAKSIGAYPAIGCLDIGSAADVLILSEDLSLKQVI